MVDEFKDTLTCTKKILSDGTRQRHILLIHLQIIGHAF